MMVKKFTKNNKLILKTQQIFKNDFTEEINEIALSSNDDKIMESIDLIETCAYGTRKDLVGKKENTIEKIEEHNSNWPQLLVHLHRILITEGSGFGKVDSLFKLISHQ